MRRVTQARDAHDEQAHQHPATAITRGNRTNGSSASISSFALKSRGVQTQPTAAWCLRVPSAFGAPQKPPSATYLASRALRGLGAEAFKSWASGFAFWGSFPLREGMSISTQNDTMAPHSIVFQEPATATILALALNAVQSSGAFEIYFATCPFFSSSHPQKFLQNTGAQCSAGFRIWRGLGAS